MKLKGKKKRKKINKIKKSLILQEDNQKKSVNKEVCTQQSKKNKLSSI